MDLARAAFLASALAAGCRAPVQSPEPLPPPPVEVRSTPPREAPEELKELRRRIRDHLARSVSLKREAHEALDRGQYDRAAALHRESIECAKAADEARGAEEGLVRAAAVRLIRDLEDDDIGVRESATRDLIVLAGDAALLRTLAKDLSAEAGRRMDLVLRILEDRLLMRQWATGATASTEYSSPNWAAMQATGAPNTAGAGDHTTAWASKAPDGDTEWLALTYDVAVEPVTVRVHETYNAGAISKVELRDATGAWRTAWEGPAGAVTTPRWFEVQVDAKGWVTKEVRITLDSDAVPSWNEIDAVQLIGRDPAVAALR